MKPDNTKKTYFIGGKHSCIEAIKNSKRKIHKIYVSDQKKYDTILKLNKKIDIKIKDKLFFNNIFNQGFNHQGYAAEVYPLEIGKFEDFLLRLPNLDTCNIVFLDSILDDRNLGSIMRTCLSFYVDALILNKKDYRFQSYNLNKSSSGSVEYLDIYTVSNIKNAIEKLKKKGFWIYALDQNATKSIYDIKFEKFSGFVFGSEEKGVKKNIYNYCDETLQIPINPLANSLNVSNALSATLSIIKKNPSK